MPRAPDSRSASPTMRSSRSAVISESVTGRCGQSAGRSSKLMTTSLARARRNPVGFPHGPDSARWLDDVMSLESDYVPSPKGWVRDDVAKIEQAGDTNVVDRQGRPVILVTMH